jgi:hypothetical protein
MEPAPSVACLRQRLQSCAKRAGGGLAYHQGKRGTGHPPPRAATRQTWLRDGVAAGAAWGITQALACGQGPLTGRASGDGRWRGGGWSLRMGPWSCARWRLAAS